MPLHSQIPLKICRSRLFFAIFFSARSSCKNFVRTCVYCLLIHTKSPRANTCKKEKDMCTQPTRKERIFSHWDNTDVNVQRTIFNEFKIKHKGCYTRKDLMNFLEQKLLGRPDSDKLKFLCSSANRDRHQQQ